MIISYLRQRLSAVLTHQRDTRTAAVSTDALEAALASLPETSRSVYLLHARDGVSIPEIAVRLDILPTDVEQHLAAALGQLDRQIGTICDGDAVAQQQAER